MRTTILHDLLVSFVCVGVCLPLFASHHKPPEDGGVKQDGNNNQPPKECQPPPNNQGQGGSTGGSSSAFKVGFFPYPIFGVDHDRNRFIVYLGNKDNPEASFNKLSNAFNGPYLLVETGFLSGNLGLILSPLSIDGGGFVGAGLGVSGRSSYESWRITNTYEEAKNLPRLKKFPRTAEEVLALPPNTVMVSRLNGSLIMPIKMVLAYVFSFGPEIGISGEWVVMITKTSSYSVLVSLQNTKEKTRGLVTALGTAQWREIKASGKQKNHLYELSLENAEGMELYNQIFKGNLTALEKALAQQSSAIKKITNERALKQANTAPLLTELISGSAHKQLRTSTSSIGIPILATRVSNRASLEMVNEKSTFLVDQEGTPLGPVPAGTVLKTVRGGFYRFTMLQGRMTRHKLQALQFISSLDEVFFPGGVNSQEQLYPIPTHRVLSALHFTSRKNQWKEGEWQQALEKLAATLPVPLTKLRALPFPQQVEKTDFAEISASLKISEAALQTLAATIVREGEEQFNRHLQEQAHTSIIQWFADKSNQQRALCRFSLGCKGRVLKKSLGNIARSSQHLLAAFKLIPQGSAKLSSSQKKAYIRDLVAFGRYFSTNVFTVQAFLSVMENNRRVEARNDYALCVKWQGSRIRHDVLVVHPSLTRQDRDKCFLKEETLSEATPEIPDRLKYVPPRLL